MKIRKGYCFDDVLLVPKFSTLLSRSKVDISTHLGRINLQMPIVSANMINVTGADMAIALSNLGGLPILHRFYDSISSVIHDFSRIKMESSHPENIGASVGIQESDKYLADSLINAGCSILCVDVAHGHHQKCGEMVSYIAKRYPRVCVIAGNVATGAAARWLYDFGAAVIKCGIGPGSLCTTRIETGNGVPQLTALYDVYKDSLRDDCSRKYHIIADGGIKRAGDIVKALCFSDAVMLGNLLAGTDEAPGKVIHVNGYNHKEYVGSSTLKNNHIEGVKALVPCKGPVSAVLQGLVEGLRSGCSYQGACDLKELREDPEFIEISSSGLGESHPHDVMVQGG